MNHGKVKWFSEAKGFGFIESDDGKDIFVHRSGLLSAFGGLTPEQEVEFEVRQGDKGLVAFNVK